MKNAIGAGDYAAFDELMTPALATEFKDAIRGIKQAFPDYAGDNEQIIVEGDTAAIRFVYNGTHEGEYLGVAPTGRRVTFTGIAMNRYADGKIAESTIEIDDLGVLQQLGANTVPSPPE